MARMRHVGLRSIFSVLALALTLAPAHSQTAPPLAAVARVWADHVVEIEQYLKSAEVVGIEELKVGVTKPRRAKLAPGGPCRSDRLEADQAGTLQRLLGELQVRDRRLRAGQAARPGHGPADRRKGSQGRDGRGGHVGLAGEKFQGAWWRAGPEGRERSAAGADRASWTRQITVAKMFDNLIGNIDPNLGNWLVDPNWNLILIDHTRAFTNTRSCTTNSCGWTMTSGRR